MNILLLAPHPFYQERGTPIAVNLLLQALSRLGHAVDVLTYHEGMEVSYPGVTLHRIRKPLFARNVPPGPSLKKILCDLVMLPKALSMASRKPYDLVHAIEESVYMAMWIRRRNGIPYLYDMDSSLARQVAEKFSFLGFLLPLMTRMERAAIRGALAVVPVCEALAKIAEKDGANKVVLLRDISLLSPASSEDLELARTLVPRSESPCFMYVGNLEAYQGIDLMLDSFAEFLKGGSVARLVIAGGKAEDIQRYREKAKKLGIGKKHPISGAPTCHTHVGPLYCRRCPGIAPHQGKQHAHENLFLPCLGKSDSGHGPSDPYSGSDSRSCSPCSARYPEFRRGHENTGQG